MVNSKKSIMVPLTKKCILHHSQENCPYLLEKLKEGDAKNNIVELETIVITQVKIEMPKRN